ncbi:MAG: hypothetical protein JRH14_15005 [Deltaproteobacteria bacterium]|nr:hypothetical protein [Deltaproteobacteria bacterium]
MPVALVIVETKEVLQFADGLGKSVFEGGAMVAPDSFDGLADLLFHDEHTVQLTV